MAVTQRRSRSNVSKPTRQSRSKKHRQKDLTSVDKPLRQVEYEPKPYEYFQSLNWAQLWKDFLELGEKGKFKYATAHQFCQHVGGNKDERKWLYYAIGPKQVQEAEEVEDDTLKPRKKVLPYVGDWTNLRSSLFVGETNKESILYGNPKLQVLRETLKTHIDALSTSKGIAELMMDWIGRWTTYSHQVDEYFEYRALKKDLTDEQNDKRFNMFMEMQERLEKNCMTTSRMILRCLGIGEDDVNLLSQMMIATMRQSGVLGEEGTKALMMMQLAAHGGKPILDAGALGSTKPQSEEQSNEEKEMEAVEDAFKSPTLKLMLGTFIKKAAVFKMPHPDLKMDSVPDEEDDSTEPEKKKKQVTH